VNAGPRRSPSPEAGANLSGRAPEGAATPAPEGAARPAPEGDATPADARAGGPGEPLRPPGFDPVQPSQGERDGESVPKGYARATIRHFFRRALASIRESNPGSGSAEWPRPEVSAMAEPRFLFILTPPYSGSTALARILTTARGTALLHRNAEGQWLVPGMCAVDRWDPEKKIDWTSVRAVWMSRIETVRSLGQAAELIIEKSPPNMVRLNPLLATFPEHSVVAFNRNPFAQCSSVIFRHHDSSTVREGERRLVLERIANEWLLRSTWIRRWIEEKEIPFFSYERFCVDPGACIAPLLAAMPLLGSMDESAEIRVKDYPPQRLGNQNERQIAKLRRWEVGAIADVLSRDTRLVASFGYDPTGREELLQARAR